MTDRIPLDHLTSDALDALYEQLEAAEATESQRQLATAREALASATTRAARAEADLAALRRVARGYCPACGRGDASPTVEDWEQQRQRADEAEGRLAHLQQSSEAIGRFLTRTADERDQLRAALARVQALAEEYSVAIPTNLIDEALLEPTMTGQPEAIAYLSASHAGRTQPHTGLVVQPYRTDRGDRTWVFRCWGTDTCDGWLSLDHPSQQSAMRALDRHVTEEHAALDEPAAGPAATEATDGPKEQP